MKKLIVKFTLVVFVIFFSTQIASAMKQRLINFDYNGGDFITTWEFDLDEDGFWDGFFYLQGGQITSIIWYPILKESVEEIDNDLKNLSIANNLELTSIFKYGNEKLIISLDESDETKYITIYDLAGNSVFSTHFNENSKEINLLNLINGGYIIIIKTSIGIKSEKFIINK